MRKVYSVLPGVDGICDYDAPSWMQGEPEDIEDQAEDLADEILDSYDFDDIF